MIFRTILRNPSVVFASLGTMCHDIAYAGLMMWLVSFIILIFCAISETAGTMCFTLVGARFYERDLSRVEILRLETEKR
jgi:hypothetical protein